MLIKEITVTELKNNMNNQYSIQLIDIREKDEYDFVNLGGELIPQGKILHNIDKISRKKRVVIMCRSGRRSANVIKFLENKFGFENLYNLKGGIIEWSDKIDPGKPKY